MSQYLLIGCALIGINISVASPENHMPDKYYIEIAKKINKKIKIEVLTNPKEAVKSADLS